MHIPGDSNPEPSYCEEAVPPIVGMVCWFLTQMTGTSVMSLVLLETGGGDRCLHWDCMMVAEGLCFCLPLVFGFLWRQRCLIVGRQWTFLSRMGWWIRTASDTQLTFRSLASESEVHQESGVTQVCLGVSMNAVSIKKSKVCHFVFVCVCVWLRF